MDAPELTTLLASDDPVDRARAYAVLEATEDVALAVACVAPLTAVCGRSIEEVDASELQRASLTLGHLISLDCLAVGGEWMKESRWLITWSSEGNALNTTLRKPVDELTRADALLCAAVEVFLMACAKGYDPLLESAGLTVEDWVGPFMGATPHGPVRGNDERNNRLSSLITDALREDRQQMTDVQVAGAFSLLTMMMPMRPATAAHQIEIGTISLAIAELRTMPSTDRMSVSRCPFNRAGAAMSTFAAFKYSDQRDAGTPGLLEVCLETLAAYARVGLSDDTNTLSICYSMEGLLYGGLYGLSDDNAAAIRAAAPSFRFVLDNPVVMMAEMGYTTATSAGLLTAEVFGRDEGDVMQMSQADIDNLVKLMNFMFHGKWLGGAFGLPEIWSHVWRNICVSDCHKQFVLANPDAIPQLVSALFLDPDHPMGLRAKEILGPQATPTPIEMQAVYQQNHAEALAQIALFPDGKAALLEDDSTTAALEALVEQGFTEEAKEFARTALIGLRGFAKHETVVPLHIMLSYNWEDQPIGVTALLLFVLLL